MCPVSPLCVFQATLRETDCSDQLFLCRGKGNEVLSSLHSSFSTAIKQHLRHSSRQFYVQCYPSFVNASELPEKIPVTKVHPGYSYLWSLYQETKVEFQSSQKKSTEIPVTL